MRRYVLMFTIALVVTVIFFSIEVPYAESRNLRKKVEELKTVSTVSASFNTVLKEAMDELNKFGNKAESPKAINQRIQYKVMRMEELMRDIPNSQNSIYPLIVQNISDLNNAKLKLSEANIQ